MHTGQQGQNYSMMMPGGQAYAKPMYANQAYNRGYGQRGFANQGTYQGAGVQNMNPYGNVQAPQGGQPQQLDIARNAGGQDKEKLVSQDPRKN